MSDTICVVPIPGPQGVAGADGADGTDGVSAFTTTTASFTMPDGTGVSPDVTITVATNEWASVHQFIFIRVGSAVGTFKVISKTGTTQMSVRNMEDGTGVYDSNSAPGTPFASGATVGPTGEQGPAGAAGVSGAPTGATYITQTANGTLSAEQPLAALATGIMFSTTATGVVSTIGRGVANTNIAPVDDASGLTSGEAVFATASGIESKTASASRTALGLAIGTNVQAWDAMLDALAALVTSSNDFIYFTGANTPALSTVTTFMRNHLLDASASAARTTLNVLAGYGILASATAVDHNAVADTAMTLASGRYIIDKIMVDNASVSLTTARSGLFTAAGGAGTTLAADQVLTALTASTKYRNLTNEAVVGTDIFTSGTLYYRVGTAQGGAATANVRIFGWDLD